MTRLTTLFLTIFFLLLGNSGNGQAVDSIGHRTDSLIWKNLYFKVPFTEKFSDQGIIIGVHQFDNTFFELGYSFATGYISQCAFGTGFLAGSVSIEYNPFGNVGGIAASLWNDVGTIFLYGLNINFLGKFESQHTYLIGVRPIIGIGGERLTLYYGYNFFIRNTYVSMTENFPGFNRHNIALRFFIPLKEKITFK